MNLQHVKVIRGKENRGWNGDVPVVRLCNTKLKKLGWKSKYTSKQAVVKTIRILLGKKNT